MRDCAEYEFVLPDGTCRYDMIDLTVPAVPQVAAFKRLHGAVAAWPVERGGDAPQVRSKLKRRQAALRAMMDSGAAAG